MASRVKGSPEEGSGVMATRVPAAVRPRPAGAGPARAARGWRVRRVPAIRTILIAAAVYLIAIIFLLPYLEMLITALRPQRELLDRDYLPHHWAWSNLTNMWGAGFGITSSLRVSLEVAGGATILVTLVALPAAYYTARHRFRGRVGVLLRVTLPLAAPGLVAALIFTFIAAWNEFIAALTLTTSNSAIPLTVRLDSFIGQYTVDWQHLFGASLVATIPVLILFALIERRVVGGLTAGSIR